MLVLFYLNDVTILEMFQLGRLDVFLHALDLTSFSEKPLEAMAHLNITQPFP